MIDIVKFKTDKKFFGFSKIYNFNDFKIIEGGDDDKNRKALENRNTDILLSPEKTRNKDFMHSRDSGLNQVLCKIAKKNEIAIGFNFNEVLISKNRHLILGKMMQNVKLCRKYKVNMIIISGANDEMEMKMPKDLISFGKTIGKTAEEAKKALNFKKEK